MGLQIERALLPNDAWDGRVTTVVAGRSGTGCAVVAELALGQRANAMRQDEWDSLCGWSLFCLSLLSVGWILWLDSARSYIPPCEWKESTVGNMIPITILVRKMESAYAFSSSSWMSFPFFFFSYQYFLTKRVIRNTWSSSEHMTITASVVQLYLRHVR